MRIRAKPKFTEWRRIVELCKILHPFAGGPLPWHKRSKFAELQKLAEKFPRLPGAIIYHEIRALVAEFSGDIKKAIRCRRREIELTERLHEITKDDPPRVRAYALQRRRVSDLRARRRIVATLEMTLAEKKQFSGKKPASR